MGHVLYQRDWKLTVGRPLGPGASDLQELTSFGTLRTSFEVERAHKLGKEPNSSAVSVYNLAESTRSKLGDKGLSMALEAGYVGFMTTIIRADIARVTHRREGPDWITRLEADDGGRGLAQTRVSLAFAAGARAEDILKTVARKLPIAMGKALEEAKSSNFQRGLEVFAHGFVASGNANQVLDDLARTTGLEWSVQNNELVITRPGYPTSDEAVVLGPDSGLVGSPMPGEEGKLQVKALIMPGLEPARKVKIISRTLEGFARIEKTKYSGDTHEEDWYATMEVTPL